MIYGVQVDLNNAWENRETIIKKFHTFFKTRFKNNISAEIKFYSPILLISFSLLVLSKSPFATAPLSLGKSFFPKLLIHLYNYYFNSRCEKYILLL